MPNPKSRSAVSPFARPLVAAAAVVGFGASASWGQPEHLLRRPMPWPGSQPAATFTPADDAFLDELTRASFLYFVEQVHPVTGLVHDRAPVDGSARPGKASIAGSGFAFAGWAIAAHRGWVERAAALDYVRRALAFLCDRAQQHRGFFYHFMEMDTGERAWSCELSSIDTALMLVGAIAAREYFQDPEITARVNQLYRAADWQWFLNGGQVLALGWRPETGFSRYRWVHYSEQMMMPLLGLGSPEPAHRLEPEHWRAWERSPVGSYGAWTFLQGPPLFMHQFTHAYFDFRGRRDAYADYHLNSILATLAQRQAAMDLRPEFPAWGERLWGVTSSDAASGYKGWGLPPRTLNNNALDGTLVPCAAAGSIPFAPHETLLTLRHMRTAYGDRIWGRYGFADAFNPHTGWVATDNIGIDVGITMLMAENARSGFIWALFMQAPEIQQAMARAGFLSTGRALTWQEQTELRRMAEVAWQSLANEPLQSHAVGLQITATLASQALGLANVEDVSSRAEIQIRTARMPADEKERSRFAAALLTARQAFPRLAAAATERWNEIDWTQVEPTQKQIGSGSRLTVFFQVATGAREPAAWDALARDTQPLDPVHVLMPATVEDHFLPGLWLDEREIITGASASQLAYHRMYQKRMTQQPSGTARSVLNAALLIDHFLAEVVDDLRRDPLSAEWVRTAAPSHRAALLIAIANVLVPGCVRTWFQQDPVVQQGRRRIRDFGEAAYGPNVSVVARRELAGPLQVPPPRELVARPVGLGAEALAWQTMSGLEYQDSRADVRPEDPPLELRFAFSWDEAALHFHAVVYDTPPGSNPSPDRTEAVELFVDPQSDGLEWASPDDFQFSYDTRLGPGEFFRGVVSEATIERTETGYTVHAILPWDVLGLIPTPGLELAISPAVVRSGPGEYDPSLKLNWRFFRRLDERVELATLKLE